MPSKDRIDEFNMRINDLYDLLDGARDDKDIEALRAFESSINNLYLEIVDSAYRIEGK